MELESSIEQHESGNQIVQKNKGTGFYICSTNNIDNTTDLLLLQGP
jgi:hypothetical protein